MSSTRSMIKTYTKEQVTRAILDVLLDKGKPYEDNVDRQMGLWWVTKRSPSGFQLAGPGQLAFTLAEIEYDDKILDATNLSVFSIERDLNKKLRCPFWVEHNSRSDIKHRHAVVRLYDGRIANWIDLLGGVSDYLRSVDGYLPN